MKKLHLNQEILKLATPRNFFSKLAKNIEKIENLCKFLLKISCLFLSLSPTRAHL